MVPVIALAGCGISRMADADAAPPSGTRIDVIGAWHDCATTYVFEGDGTARYTNHRDGCSATGAYTVAGNVITTRWTDEACTHATIWTREGLRSGAILVIVDPVSGSLARLADDATPRSRWRLDGIAHGVPAETIMRVIGTPGVGYGTGCYWSADHMCNGIFSCGGGVSTWNVDATTWHLTTTCNGDCPCGAILDGTVQSDGTVDATYRGASCMMPLSGTFTATQIPDT